jgi:hypothetical protein
MVVYAIIFSVGALYILRLMNAGPSSQPETAAPPHRRPPGYALAAAPPPPDEATP